MFELRDSDYERFRDLISTRTGLHYPETKRADLSRSLLEMAKTTHVTDIEQYYNQLFLANSHDDVWRQLVQRLTIGETYFFRDSAQLQALRSHILPKMIEARRKAGLLVLRLWSAGCATGEEPYTLAMLLKELIYDIDAWNIFILATDINRDSLVAAQKGVYKDRAFRTETPDYIRERYFETTPEGAMVRPYIKRMVRFSYLNLIEDVYPSTTNYTNGFDLIMCRNVTIYFTAPTTQKVVSNFFEALVPDGWLVVGHSEPMSSLYHGFEPRNFPGAIIYQKATPVKPHYEPQAELFNWNPSVQPETPLAPPIWEKPPEPIKPTPRIIIEPVETAQECYVKGKEAADKMQWELAHQWLTRALGHNPLMIEAHFARALVYMHEGDTSAALEALRRVLYLDSNFVLGYFNIGLIHFQQGLLKEAKRSWLIAQSLLEDAAPNEILPYSDDLQADYVLKMVRSYLARLADVSNTQPIGGR